MRPLPLRAPTAFTGSLKTLALALFVPVLLLCCASTAQADPIVVTGGTASTSLGTGNFFLNVTAPGFSFTGSNTSAAEIQLCGLCQPGFQFGGGAIPVRVDQMLGLTYNGVSYNQGYVIVSNGNFITLPLLTVPSDLSPIVTPFSFVGRINVNPTDGSAPFQIDLVGAGTATFTFIQSGGGVLSRGVFTFAPPPEPVPEPATMLLLGTGLAGMAAAKLRKRRKA